MKKSLIATVLILSLIVGCCKVDAECIKRAGKDTADIFRWININDKEMKLHFDLADLIVGVNRRDDATPEEAISDANKLIGLLIMNNGKDFTHGRKLRYESTYLLYAYEKYVNADVQLKNCENARVYFNKLRKLIGQDYLVVEHMGPRLIDPALDADIYKREKAVTERRLLTDLDLSNACFEGEEYAKWKRIKGDIEFLNGFSNKEAYAFGYWEKKPRNGIISAENLIKTVDDSDGHKFSNGKVFSRVSSLVLAAYTAMAIGYDHKPSCKNARMYMDKIGEYATRDYQVIILETGEIHNPSDGEVYKEQKKCDLETIMNYGIPAYKCFSKEEFTSQFKSEE
jgi:hypothetical protein